LEDEIMVVKLSGTQPQGPKHLETLENKTVDGTQNNLRINRGTTANRPGFPIVGEFYYNTDKQAFEQYTLAGWFNIAQAPNAPTSLIATDQGTGKSFNDGQASLAFTPSTSGGAPSSFIVTPSPPTSPATFTGTSSPITITGLSSSTQYTYTATAVGTYGTSSASTASSGVTATTVPQAPIIGTATGTDDGSGTATVTFTAGSTGGSAITSFTATSTPGSLTASGASSPLTISGLTLDTAYTFTTTATNSNGTSLSSSPSNSVTPTLVVVSYESIASYVLTSNTDVTFSSIPQTYKILQVRFHGAAQDHYVHMRTNLGIGTWSHGPRNLTSSLGINISAGYNPDGFYLNNGGVSVTYRGSMITEFIDYADTSKFKTAINWYGSQVASSSQNNMLGMYWASTNPITSITVKSDGIYTLSTGTVVSLYGIKG